MTRKEKNMIVELLEEIIPSFESASDSPYCYGKKIGLLAAIDLIVSYYHNQRSDD